MTRIDSVRAATGTAKDSVLHAADSVAPYAGTAKDTAARYAHEARVRMGPKVSHAAHQARCAAGSQYHAHIAPRLEDARGALPPKVDAAATRAAGRTRRAARQAADYTAPRVEHAMTATRAAAERAEPLREEAVTRSAAAIAALRNHVTAADIERLARKRRRRARTGRAAKRISLLGVLGAGIYVTWKWWDKQANPDWLVEPPAATEVADRDSMTSLDGGDRASLDPEVQAKQAKADAEKPDDQR